MKFDFILLLLLQLVLDWYSGFVAATFRHRHSFFLDAETTEDVLQDTDALHYQSSNTVRLKQFHGVREWKVVIPLDEFVNTFAKSRREDLLPWNEKWVGRVQIASEIFYDAAPFITGPLPGTHVSFDFREEQFDRFTLDNKMHAAVCEYFDMLLQVFACDRSVSLEAGNRKIDLEKSIMIHTSTYLFSERLSIEEVLRKGSPLGEYHARQNGMLMPSLLDLALKHDVSLNVTVLELRMAWKVKGQDIDIIKREDVSERVEVGLFYPAKLDLETYLGVKTVIGEGNKHIEPTMLLIPPPFFYNSTYNFNSWLSPANGLHPIFHVSLHADEGQACTSNILYILPNSFFVDPYQLKEHFPEAYITALGETDLELPVGVDSLRWGSVVVVPRKKEFSLPLHMRYQEPTHNGPFETRTHTMTRAPWPIIVQECEPSKEHHLIRRRMFSQNPLPISLVWRSDAYLAYPVPTRADKSVTWPSVSISVPVGRLAHIKSVEWWTIVAALVGSGCLMWILWKKFVEIEYLTDKNKRD